MSAPSTPEPCAAKRVRSEDLVDEVNLGAGPNDASLNAPPVLSPKLTPVNQPISVSRTTPPGAPVRKTDQEREQEKAEAAAALVESIRVYLRDTVEGQAAQDPGYLLRQLNVLFPKPRE